MKIRKYIAVFLTVLLSLQLCSLLVVAERIETGTGKSINTSIEVTSGTIKSREEVNLRVNISSSAGDFLIDNGNIIVTIPRDIVYNVTDFSTKLIIPEPFKLEHVEKDKINYLLTFSIDRSMIGDNDAFNGIFQIKFGAPILRVGDDHEDIQKFTVNYAKQTAYASAEVQKENTLIPPIFDKWYKGDFDENGIANLNTIAPEGNRFQLVVNYKGIQLNDVVVSDTLPKGTSLISAPVKTSMPGDPMVKDNIRVFKVTDFDEEGTAIHYRYVTAELEDKIVYDKVTNKFTVDFGDIEPNETYFVEYSVKVEDLNLGVQENIANLTASNRGDIEKSVSVQATKYHGTSYVLNKSVDKTTLNHDENELTYTLKLELLDGDAIPAGTIITDPLDPRMTKPEIATYDKHKYDIRLEDNKVIITTLKDIQQGEMTSWEFKVSVENLKMGEALSNRAFLTVPDNVVYSNSVSTRKYDGRIQIKKLDNVKNPVAGAMYTIFNEKNDKVFEGVTDEAGSLTSSALRLGAYTVVETAAPAGYILDSTPYYVVVKESDTIPIILGTENKLKLGSVELTKIDAMDQKFVLAGAEFELLDSNGGIVFENLKTDMDGKIVVFGLMPGQYQFIETKAPEGYVLDSTPVAFDIEIGENDAAVQVSKKNNREVSLLPEEPEQLEVLPNPPMKAPEQPRVLPKPPMKAQKPQTVPSVKNVVGVATNGGEKIVPNVEKLPGTGDSSVNWTIMFGFGMAMFSIAILIRKEKS